MDDIITELQKQQSKKKHRNPNPLPDFICIFGWCRERSRQKTPPTVPEIVPETKTPGSNAGSSSNRAPADKCDDAMEKVLEAAHNTDVGDYYFAANQYDAALLRYKDAAEEKPADAAIHVRLGRVLEKLGRIPAAIQEYKAAQELAGPAKWSEESRAALLRLQPPPRP